MPVTFSPAPHNTIEPYAGEPAASPAALLKRVRMSTSHKKAITQHLQSSFGCGDTRPVSVTPQRHGFVHTVLDAYNNHHALAIRPDDVWLAILTQFSLFVNGEGRAEQLRHLFVAHEGKKALRIHLDGGLATSDYGRYAAVMSRVLHENIVDPELRAWCLPGFSTTTPADTVVASVVMMATLKSYFEFVFRTKCGLPRVTLLGTQDDWRAILGRADKLAQYSAETAAWRELLRPVLARFVRASEPGCAESAENIDFWQRAVHVGRNESGGRRLSGWLTAFCAFDDKGAWMGTSTQGGRPTHGAMGPGSSPPERAPAGRAQACVSGDPPRMRDGELRLDGIRYHSVRLDDIPAGHAEVEVIIEAGGTRHTAAMVAGLVGTTARDALTDAGRVPRGEISPASGWWICLTGAEMPVSRMPS